MNCTPLLTAGVLVRRACERIQGAHCSAAPGHCGWWQGHCQASVEQQSDPESLQGCCKLEELCGVHWGHCHRWPCAVHHHIGQLPSPAGISNACDCNRNAMLALDNIFSPVYQSSERAPDADVVPLRMSSKHLLSIKTWSELI